jgi:hypothetical protein
LQLTALLIRSLAILPQVSAEAIADPTAEEVDGALTRFGNAFAAVQAAAIAEVESRVLSLRDLSLLELRHVALEGQKPVRRDATPFHSPQTFTAAEATRTRLVRQPADPESPDYADKRGRFLPWFNDPPFAASVEWDFGANRPIATAPPITPYWRLWNALNGYVPDSDRVVAFVLSKFDFEKKHDALATYFGHAYCDLNGRIYPEITLYDAWASGGGMDMPDVDTIAFARSVLKDSSYVAPLPPDARRQKLYTAISDNFLACFQYRVWIEGAAWLWLNPEADIFREGHEPLRRRLLHLFGQEDGDLGRVARRLEEIGTRDRFIETIDAAVAADPSPDRTIARFTKGRVEERWKIARAAHSALREHHLLGD